MTNQPHAVNRSVSVVIPVYNSAFVEEAVASAYAQTLVPSQVIVINDGSTDDTEDRLRRLASDVPPTFSWRTQPHGGSARARNFGVRLSLGEHIAFLDHDDRWDPEKLDRQVTHLASAPEVAMSFTGYRYDYASYRESVGRTAYPLSVMHHDHWDSDPTVVLAHLLAGRWCVGTMSAVMIRREALACLPAFDEQLVVTSDIAMYLALVVRGMRMDYLPCPLVDYRWHGTNISRDVGTVWEDSCRMYDRFWDEHSGDIPPDLREQALRWRAHCHLQTAIDAIRHDDRPRARRHILTAARIRPSAVRPGWVRMLGLGRPPRGPWPQ